MAYNIASDIQSCCAALLGTQRCLGSGGSLCALHGVAQKSLAAVCKRLSQRDGQFGTPLETKGLQREMRRLALGCL
eukprot:5777134-Amphidinium_carterae.1